jgi:hypothetical protein
MRLLSLPALGFVPKVTLLLLPIFSKCFPPVVRPRQ